MPGQKAGLGPKTADFNAWQQAHTHTLEASGGLAMCSGCAYSAHQRLPDGHRSPPICPNCGALTDTMGPGFYGCECGFTASHDER